MSRVRIFSHRHVGLIPLLLSLLWPAMALTQDRTTPTTDAVKLLLTEVSAWSDYSNPQQHQYIEIMNPNDFDVDLSDYYLTDASVSGPSPAARVYYWRIAETPQPDTLAAWRQRIGGGGDYNFHARFPDSYVLAAEQSIVISVGPAEGFSDIYEHNPHLQLYGEDDGVMRMRAVFGDPGDDSIVGSGASNPPRLDTDSESVVLYHWDGESDHVTDIDVFFWGSNINRRFSKNGTTVGEHAYEPETQRADQLPLLDALTAGRSFHRADMQETGQPGEDGNGVGGRDEVGEPFPETWTVAACDPARPDGDPFEPGDVAKLLLTEVSVLGTDQEYVEIYNPNDFGVDMSDYYLTDANYTPGSQHYWRIAEGNPQQNTVGGGDFYDFHARFPDGYVLPAGQFLVVSIAGSMPFFNEFGFYPHIELHGTGPAPRMRPVFGDIDGPNSIVGSGEQNPPTLTNSSEIVVLYHWDGQSDLVTDIDVFMWGTGSSNFFSKTGVTVGGQTYQNETAVDDQEPYVTAASFGNSYHRTDMDETGQPGPPGNGVGGRDEMGEPLMSTWTIAPYDPAEPGGVIPGDELTIVEASLTGAMTGRDVVMRARVFAGEDPIESVTVDYSINNGATQSLTAGLVGNNWYEANLGQYPAGTVIRWRLEVAAGDETVTYPSTPGDWADPVEIASDIALVVPPKTFVPDLEIFRFDFITRSGYETKIRLFDLQGRLVLTFHDSRFDGQVNDDTITWDGRDATFERVRAGMYVIHLQAVDPATGETTIQTAPVVVATRLN
jgi:hypothetical protein